MNQVNFHNLTTEVPELAELKFSTVDELVDLLSKNNRYLWPTLKYLIGEQLRNYFQVSNLRFKGEDSIYNATYFGYYSTETEQEISDSLNLTFPRRDVARSSIIIVATTILFWLTLITAVLTTFPEILIFGSDLIIPNFLLIALLPMVVLRLTFPRQITKLLSKKKFSRIETFNDLTEVMYGLNLWRYRDSQFERLKTELNELTKKAS